MAPHRFVPAALLVARSTYGGALLLAPARWLSAVARTPVDRPAAAVARVLGARELAQAALVDRRPTRDRLLVGAGVDAAHAASMVPVARWAHRRAHRRLAARSARTATGFATASLIAAAAVARRDASAA